mgnify:CR=1 FL=1
MTDPNAMKYLIRAKIITDGIIEKPDIIGAIFGQTEGLLGEGMDLRDLQKSGRVGRIEVDVDSKRGKSEGEILLPSGLDNVETAILAASLETIDRVGPCKAQIDVLKIEDIRVVKRNRVIERARELLSNMLEQQKGTTEDMISEVRKQVQVEEIVLYGKEKLPAGPNVATSEAIIIVEGRNDVLNLLRAGIKHAIAVEGTNVPETIKELSKERTVTIFVDGDRGGELILRELLQVCEVDYISRAPTNKEVEELTPKQIMKCLRNKISAQQFIEMFAIREEGKDGTVKFKDIPETAFKVFNEVVDEEKPLSQPEIKANPIPVQQSKPAIPAPQPEHKKDVRTLSPEFQLLKNNYSFINGKSKARFINTKTNFSKEVHIQDLFETFKNIRDVNALVIDGIITQRIVDSCYYTGIHTILGTKIGSLVKIPTGLDIITADQV